MTEATTYSAFTPKSAPFDRIKRDNSPIEIKPIAFLSSKNLPNNPRLYVSFKY